MNPYHTNRYRNIEASPSSRRHGAAGAVGGGPTKGGEDLATAALSPWPMMLSRNFPGIGMF